MPSNGSLFQLFIGFKVLKSKKMLLNPQECKLFNGIIDLLPHSLRIDDEFEYSAIFQANQQFEVVLLIHVLMQFLNFAQREVHQTKLSLEEDLIVTENESDVLVFPINKFTAYKLIIYQNGRLAFHCFIFLYPQLLPWLFRLDVVIPWSFRKYLLSVSYSLICFFSALYSFPPKFTTLIHGYLLLEESAWVILFEPFWGGWLICRKNSLRF